MKKNWILGMAVCGILSVSDSAYGQSIKDILNSAAVKDAVTTVTGGKKLTVENLAGTWTYVNPAIQLEGDNALKNVAASVASSEMEKKLKDYFIDNKIPREKRDDIVCAADGSKILWIIGCRISEDIKITKNTKRILEIRVTGEDIYE